MEIYQILGMSLLVGIVAVGLHRLEEHLFGLPKLLALLLLSLPIALASWGWLFAFAHRADRFTAALVGYLIGVGLAWFIPRLANADKPRTPAGQDDQGS